MRGAACGVQMAIEELEGLLAIGEKFHRQVRPGLLQRALKKKGVVFVIFHQKNGWARLFHLVASAAAGSSSQNLLPTPMDSMPTLPPILSTDFLTTARPMPVPSYFFSG